MAKSQLGYSECTGAESEGLNLSRNTGVVESSLPLRPHHISTSKQKAIRIDSLRDIVLDEVIIPTQAPIIATQGRTSAPNNTILKAKSGLWRSDSHLYMERKDDFTAP
jgi:hypothetical protein